MIFLFIAGTYTPFAVLAFSGTLRWVVLVTVWAGAAFGLALNLAWIDAPKWVSVLAYCAVGCVGVITIPQMFTAVGVTGSVLVIVGGLLYMVGALTYAFHWPNPFPRTFGFHEIFHLLVVAAAASQFVAVSFIVV
jgi:hemolysin III